VLEHEDEDNEVLLRLEVAPVEENVESNTFVLLCPQDGQLAPSLSLSLRHKYSKI
jgi:hypothetical protein